ncbi:cobyrinate a,c-diamide synthase [Endothiovibrio diazotrophicus]
MAHFYISAAHKSSGKTTVSIGLCAALAARGVAVQPFKKGPDYIDPMWLGRAAGRPCHNLDFYTQERPEIVYEFARHMAGADVGLIEGNKGLYDGLALDGSNSNAALAKLLDAPVVLVVDSRGMTRGVAPLLLGYQAFDPEINIAGVIFNQVGGARHESKLRAVVEAYTDIRVIGAVQRNPLLAIDERHLGLVPSRESASADTFIGEIGRQIADQVDLDALLDLAAEAPSPAPVTALPPLLPEHGVRIGIPLDAAFNFYYPGDLEALEAAGAELRFFDALHDPHLPEVDGLFIGGGFPETQMEALEGNATLRGEIRAAIEGGLPVYAECGGLMYLTRAIEWDGRRHAMVGALPADCRMHERPRGRGYVRLRERANAPWPLAAAGAAPAEIFAHEFHHSSLENLGEVEYVYEVLRGYGINGRHDGIRHRNTLACYAHLRDVAGNRWAGRFVEFVRERSKVKGQR